MARIGNDIMCGIAGFSLSAGSRINARKLSHALLCEIESRGSQASGYAYQSAKSTGVFKSDVAGSNLSLKGMPRDASTVILHTRYATHGSVKVNANNHPVASPDGRIALVHNGVIYNHDRVRRELPFKLAEVDTSVIPAIVQKFGYERFDMLDGDASVAWLDEASRGVLMVGRVSHSPLFIAQLVDGSFVFASTELLLTNALSSMHLRVSFMQEVAERTLFTVRGGRIDAQEVLPALDPAFESPRYNVSSYRSMTAGGRSPWDSASPYTAGRGYAWELDGATCDTGFWDVTGDEDEEFEDYLCSFIEVDDNRFYDYHGVFVGTRESLFEDFDEYKRRSVVRGLDDEYVFSSTFFDDELF